MQLGFIMHDEVARAHLALLESRLLMLDIPLVSIANLVTEEILGNFESGSWPPLAPATSELKAALGYPADPLVRTGAMKGAATSNNWQVSRAGRGWVAKLEVPGYSNFHFTGTRFMPMRDYALLHDAIEGSIIGILETFLFEGLSM